MMKLLTWLGLVDQRPGQLDTIDLFLAGHSIPALSAAAGQDMIAEQRRIEQRIRAYVLQLEQQIAELQSEY